MKRLHLFEIHDQAWCPRALRDAATGYLQFMGTATKPYATVVPLLASALRDTGARQVLDLCSGAGGPWPWLQPALASQGVDVRVCLTDKYPHGNGVNPVGTPDSASIRYHTEPVDAAHVDPGLPGFRTMFTAFHHFRPEEARAILNDAIRSRQGIAIFEGSARTPLGIAAMLLVPLTVLLMTPFIRPFRWSGLLWTYVLPVIPLVIGFDGLVSTLRTYTTQELQGLVNSLDAPSFDWQIGSVKSTAGPIPVTFLIGIPRNPPAPPSP